MEENNLIKKPFVSYTLEEDKGEESRRTLNVSFNNEELAKVHKAQELLNIKMEGTAIKIVFEIGFNVLLNTLGESNLIYLTSQKRTRLNS